MAKELVLTMWLHDDTNVNEITDALNEVLRDPCIYPLIDDIDDELGNVVIEKVACNLGEDCESCQ